MTPDQDRLRSALAERYAVTDVLGEGGMATVYRAADLKHNRAVAIKVLRPELSHAIGGDRFLREIEIVAGLQHPRILPLYDSGQVEGLLYYVMPLVEGESLRHRLEREKQLPLDDAVRIAREVASALAYAHARGIVHRDIKPENILLSGGEAVVADFGIARALGAAGGDRLTITGMSIGTPGYMSPEQVGGQSDVDGRSDIYSLGCLVYEMIAGQPPFTGATAESVVLQHMAAPIPRVAIIRPTVSPAVAQAIERALAKVPADRFATATAFAEALVAPAVSLRRRLTLPPVARWATIIGAAGVVVVAGVATLLRDRRQPAVDSSVIAVLPFKVSADSSVAFLREGMVDLLTTQLGAMTGLRPVDSRTVLAAWRRAVRAGDEPSNTEAVRLAASMGSGRVVLGEIVAIGAGLTIVARVRDVASDSQLAAAAQQGPYDSLFVMVDRLTSQLIAGSAGEPGRRLADLTSTSLPALRAYLDGRAAIRRGEIARAQTRFSEALEIDSTFALAALGMAASGVWSQQSGQSAALRRGLLTGYALRERLPRRDQLLFEAYVLPNTPTAHSAGEQLEGWRRAAEAAPDSPEAQYEYADRLYHSGAQLGLLQAQVRAESSFAKALMLDSTFAPPLAHLVEIAARAGDRRITRRLASLYSAQGSAADAGDYVRWRVALALGDERTLADLRARRGRMDQFALHRIIGFGQTDGAALADVDSAATELRRRLDANTVTPANVPPGQTLHTWARNRGRRSDAARAIDALRASPRPPGSSIVFFSADQVPVLAALFWDGDSAAAQNAAARIDRQIARSATRGSAARAQYFTDLCVAGLWHHSTGRAAVAQSAAQQLRAGMAMRDSAAVHGADPLLCLTMLDAMIATSNRAPEAAALVTRLDSIAVAGPYVFAIDFANLVLARLYEARGDRQGALRAVRRRPYDWDTGPLYLTTYLREEGRLAALTGDAAGAARAWQQFLALRAGADTIYKAQTDSVRSALAQLR